MSTLWHDLRFGVRTFLASPGFTIAAVLTIGLGVGANTAIFSVVNAVLLRPLPYPDADRIVVAGVSLPDYADLKEVARSFDAMAVYATNLYHVSSQGESEQILGAVVSPEFFDLLGRPMVGAGFEPRGTAEHLAVLSWSLWQRRFGGDPAVVGKTIELSRQTHTITGVMPPEFQYPGSEFMVWVPLESVVAATPDQARNRQLRIFRAVAHLAPGVRLEEAQAEASVIAGRLEDRYPDTNRGVGLRLVPLYDRVVGPMRSALLILLASVGFVLLVACANVANLLLARTVARRREIALRCALGAGRWRVARQLLTESLLLSLAGAAGGLLLAMTLMDTLPALAHDFVPRIDFLKIDRTVLLFTLGVSLLAGTLFGMAPAIHASRADLVEALKEGARGARGRRSGARLRGTLVALEAALSLVVLVGAGLLVRSLESMLTTDPGFDAGNVLSMHVELWQEKDPARRAFLASQVSRRLRAMPGVVAAGGGSGRPPEEGQRVTAFEAEGRPPLDADSRYAFFIGATPGYFQALGTPLREGRDFDDRDDERAPLVAVVNETLARRIAPVGSAVGKRLKLVNSEQKADWRTIVGVVADVKYAGLDEGTGAAIYTPFPQTPFLWMYAFVRTPGEPAAWRASVRAAVASVDPQLTAGDLRPFEEIVSRSVARPRFNALLLSAFALLCLLLAGVGIYGVVSCSVAQRTHEIGVRMALGAGTEQILRLVVGEGVLSALAGVAAGTVGALGLTRFMSSLLFGVSATDPATFAAIASLLALVALLASWLPARRACRTDPMISLRAE